MHPRTKNKTSIILHNFHHQTRVLGIKSTTHELTSIFLLPSQYAWMELPKMTCSFNISVELKLSACLAALQLQEMNSRICKFRIYNSKKLTLGSVVHVRQICVPNSRKGRVWWERTFLPMLLQCDIVALHLCYWPDNRDDVGGIDVRRRSDGEWVRIEWIRTCWSSTSATPYRKVALSSR